MQTAVNVFCSDGVLDISISSYSKILGTYIYKGILMVSMVLSAVCCTWTVVPTVQHISSFN